MCYKPDNATCAIIRQMLLEPQDRLFFLLTYLKTYALQVVHGRLFGMVQGKAKWFNRDKLNSRPRGLR
jgi:hypothetical protein